MLQIKNLNCGYSSGFTLRDINISLLKGEFTGIIGPNGSGKSTLFKSITSDLLPTSGLIMLNGKDLAQMSLRERAQTVSIVSQFAELSPITVQEYVLMGRVPYRRRFQFFDTEQDIEIATHYMELTGILHLKDKPITELSGGEQQMASIASALTQNPKVLLLDEATSHLDITHQVEIMNLLQRLNEEQGLTIVMIIHDLNLASEYCNHLIMMRKGEVYYQGTPSEVLTYEHIENVYNTVVVVRTNPISNKPVVFTVSERRLKESHENISSPTRTDIG